MDDIGDEKEEGAKALDPQSCSSNNQIIMDGIDDEKEGPIWMVLTMSKRKWKRLMDPSSPYYKMFYYQG